MQITEDNKKRLFNMLFVFVVVLSAYYAVKIFSEIKKDSMLGESTTPVTISFSGHGEVKAVPDIANIYFTISKDAVTASDAQAATAAVEKKALDFLKSKGVDYKDIQTADVSVYPKTEYRQALCPQPMPMMEGVVSSGGVSAQSYCSGGKQVTVGYTSSESITVKVHKIDDVGAIMQGLGTTGVSNLNGPSFAIDKEDALKAEARKKAIDDAKTKAEALAQDLGVSLGKISSFSESGNYPIMFAKDAMMTSGAAVPAPAQLPKGENAISSDVTITYEIR
ncbi:MAG: SIMPL domain-containing protein [bacterium]